MNSQLVLALSQLVVSTDQGSPAVPCCALGFGHVVAAASHGCSWGTASRNSATSTVTVPLVPKVQTPNSEPPGPQARVSRLPRIGKSLSPFLWVQNCLPGSKVSPASSLQDNRTSMVQKKNASSPHRR